MSTCLTAMVSAQSFGCDRLKVTHFEERLICIIADGANGISGGADAAKQSIHLITQGLSRPDDCDNPAYWSHRLSEIDADLARSTHAGETTVVVASARGDRLVGAAVGDSVAWLISEDYNITDLTHSVPRKPLVGSGAAVPVSFGPASLESAVLLLASDGLWKYAPRDQIARRACESSENLTHLVDLVRLRSGALQDDVAMILMRVCQ